MKYKALAYGVAAASAISLTIVACGGSDDNVIDVSKGTVISNATVVDTRDGSLIAGVAVVVDGGKIQRITTSPLKLSGTARSIDGTGKFVIPGLLDMHTHSLDGADLPTPYWPLLIANGVTGVREMRGSPGLIQRARQLNADSAAGRIDAPEVLLVPSVIFDGSTAASTNAAAAVQQVREQKAQGTDFIKVTNANREASLAILAEAKAQGLTVAGHLSPAMSAVESSNAGWRAIEHLGSGIGILLDCSTDEASIRQALLSGQGGVTPPFPPTWSASALTAPFYQRTLNTYSADKCQTVAKTFAANQTWHVPTLIRLRTQHFVTDQQYRTDPNLMYVDKTTRATWEAAAVRFESNIPASAATTFRQYYAQQQTMPKFLKQNGVKLLAGSDLSSISPWVVPGFSLHQEYRLLAASGLSPLEILQSTTLNGAEFLGRQATMGTVEEGKNADLVLLDGNPIQDVANLDRISGVMLKGKYFSKDALDKMKSDVAAAQASQPARQLSLVEAVHAD